MSLFLTLPSGRSYQIPVMTVTFIIAYSLTGIIKRIVMQVLEKRKQTKKEKQKINQIRGGNLILLKFVPGKLDDWVVGELEDWPFTNPKSNYVIHDDTSPKASGRILHSTPTTRTGIWHCTVGKMECTEQGDELMTILSGKVEVTDITTTMGEGEGKKNNEWYI